MRFTAGNSADPDRLERIMNSKQRLIGVDVQALNAQVEAKRHAKEQEREDDKRAALSLASSVGLLTMSQLDAAGRRKDWDKEVVHFRSTCQGKATTREWDLNRPDAKRLDLPARLGDDDSRCGPASLQAFLGEDLTMGDRVAAQMQQCKTWWNEQTAERERKRQQQLQEQQEQGTAAKQLDALQLSLRAQEAAARAQMEAQVAAENSALLAMRSAQQAAAQSSDTQTKLAELAAAASDPWLNEDPHQADSVMSPLRVRKDHWKGMSAGQIAGIKQQQAAQVESKRAAEAAAAAAEAEAAAQRRNVQRMVLLQAQTAQQARRQAAAAAAAALREQMAAKAARDGKTRELYANKVTDDYFKQFGTSAR